MKAWPKNYARRPAQFWGGFHVRLRAGGRMVNFQDKGSRAERVWEARSEWGGQDISCGLAGSCDCTLFPHLCTVEEFPHRVILISFFANVLPFLISRLKREANVGYNLVWEGWEGSHIKFGLEYLVSLKFIGRSLVNASKGDSVFSLM